MVQLLRKRIQTALLFIVLLLSSNGCKDDYESVIPYVPVNMNFPTANYIEFNIPGGFVYFPNAGYGGIIIFRDLTESSNPFIAFDAACTYETSSTCRVVTEEGSGVAKCPCCGSEYILFMGSGTPTKGPATEPLKQYRVSYTGGRILVSN